MSVPEMKQSLAGYAAGVKQLDMDLQRQTRACEHFRATVTNIDAIIAEPDKLKQTSLPFIAVTFPQDGPTPGQLKLDLNTMTPAELKAVKPVFEMLARKSALGAISAWRSLVQIADTVRPSLDRINDVTV
jgi:hypothetical protein